MQKRRSNLNQASEEAKLSRSNHDVKKGRGFFIFVAMLAVFLFGTHLSGSLLYFYGIVEPAMKNIQDSESSPELEDRRDTFGGNLELDSGIVKQQGGFKNDLVMSDSKRSPGRSPQPPRKLTTDSKQGPIKDTIDTMATPRASPKLQEGPSAASSRLIGHGDDALERLSWVVGATLIDAHNDAPNIVSGQAFPSVTRAVSGNPLPETQQQQSQPKQQQPPPPPVRHHQRPNILFVMSDDHSAEAVGFRGSKARLAKLAGTTSIDSLAAQGAFVEDFFVSLSLCSPSRATLLTGLHAHAHGVTELSGSMRQNHPANHGLTYVDELVSRGYRSALVGKWHLENRPNSFQQFKAFVRQGSYRNPHIVSQDDRWTQQLASGPGVKRATGHCSTVVASSAVAYLEAWHKAGVGTVDEDEDGAREEGGGGERGRGGVGGSSDGGSSGGGVGNRDTDGEQKEDEGEEARTAAESSTDESLVRPPFVLHVHFKETHEPWNYPEVRNRTFQRETKDDRTFLLVAFYLLTALEYVSTFRSSSLYISLSYFSRPSITCTPFLRAMSFSLAL